MEHFLKKHISKIGAITLLLLGFVFGLYIGYYFSNKKSTETFYPIRSPIKEFAFINPLIGFDISGNQNFYEFKNLRSVLNQFISEQKNNGHLSEIGLYLRNLQNGHWLGINESVEFNPGSLLKVPIMIAFLKESELQPNILTKKIYYNSKATSNNISILYPLKSKLVSGNSYTIDELIQSMIKESDNAAKDLLLDNIDKKYLDEVFYDFGVNFKNYYYYTISPKIYASFFRRIYNATYLNREFSERAMDLLVNSNYKNGIVAGVPKDISVAHKYGERGIYEGQSIEGLELHDCGIIYYNEKSMLLCIMTKGISSKENLEFVIRNITQIISHAVKNKEF